MLDQFWKSFLILSEIRCYSLQNIIDSNFGRCFTFNNDGTENSSSKPGPLYGLRLNIDVHQGDYMKTTDVAGVKVVIHNPGTHPFPQTLGQNARTGTRTSFVMTAQQTERLPLPWGNCALAGGKDESIPYFYAGNYTVQGCLNSCLQKQLIEECGCAHYG